MIKTIIIDDAKIARELLISMLNELMLDIEIVGEADNIQDAAELIKKEKPDLIFLDIEMPGDLGIDLFQYFVESEINFETIFTTAYHQYAIQAFKLSAIDYLLKPIRENELLDACNKARKRLKETMEQ